MTKFSFRK